MSRAAPAVQTRVDKGDAAIPVPGTILRHERERLGVINDWMLTPRGAREVPKSHDEFASQRLAFQRQVATYRRVWQTGAGVVGGGQGGGDSCDGCGCTHQPCALTAVALVAAYVGTTCCACHSARAGCGSTVSTANHAC
jgi:hypothetical protein